MSNDDLMPVIAVRLAEGRSGSTLLMQLLATSPQIVFDDRYPSEYRFLSYFARMASMMTEPFDAERHVGVTPFFFNADQSWGPVPFRSDVVDPPNLAVPLLRQMWMAWSEEARQRHPSMDHYAEKVAVDIRSIIEASIPLRVIDLVRDPRDVLASIRSFTAAGVDGFGRSPDIDESKYIDQFIATFGEGLRRMLEPLPSAVDRIVVRYEDLIADLHSESRRIAEWLGVELDPATVERSSANYAHHITAPSPSASVGRWHSDLTSEEAEAVAAGLRELAAAFGYQL